MQAVYISNRLKNKLKSAGVLMIWGPPMNPDYNKDNGPICANFLSKGVVVCFPCNLAGIPNYKKTLYLLFFQLIQLGEQRQIL